MAAFCDLYRESGAENKILGTQPISTASAFDEPGGQELEKFLFENEKTLFGYDFLNTDILEIGASETVTEILCPKCRSVTVIEASRPKAERLYKRFRAEKNLEVAAGRFFSASFAQKFDFIILLQIPKEGDAAFSECSFFQKIRELLNPGGRLLLMAENRFSFSVWDSGLKRKDSENTFSRQTLAYRLIQSGFGYVDFYYPCPGSQHRLTVYSDRFLPPLWEADAVFAKDFNLAQEVLAGGAFPFGAALFFIEAAVEEPRVQKKLKKAVFCGGRKIEYCVGTAFYSDGTSLIFPADSRAQAHIRNIHNTYLRLLTSGIHILDEKLTDDGVLFHSPALPTLQQVLFEAAVQGEKTVFYAWLNRFFEAVLHSGRIVSGRGTDAVLDRGYPDMVFSNCLVSGEELLFFHQEWTVENFPTGYVLARALAQFFVLLPGEEFSREVYAEFGFDERRLADYAAAEETFNGFIFEAEVCRDLPQKTGEKNSSSGPGADAQMQELTALKQKNEELSRQRREALAYAKGLENNPELLGRKRILKAFIKAFLPRLMLSACRRMVSACRKVKQGRRSSGLKYEQWIKNSAVRANEYQKLEKEPLFSLLVPLYNTDKKMLEAMIVSCLGQTYPHFELCLLDASDEEHAYVYKTAEAFAAKDARIKLKKAENLGIAGNTNACRAMAGGEYLALLDHDDCLTKNALYAMAKAINEQAPDVLYSDEDHLKGGRRYLPFFKPDFNRDLLYSQMYICHFLAFKAELFDAVGQMREEYSGSQDYDLMLRLSEKTDAICHVPDILYSWRETETSTSVNPGAKPYAHEAGRKALDEHLKRRYGTGAHAEESDYLFVYDARFDTLKGEPLLSVIIPTKDYAPLLKACVESILEKTSYSNFEVLILDNNSEEEATFACFKELQEKDARVRVIEARFPFNWSKLNNFGVQHSRGEVLVFLNNDTVVLSPDWLERLTENALRPDVGAVGALLLYEDDTIQHAGVVVGMNGWAGHVYKGMPQKHAADMFVSPMVSRDVAAVTGACMAVSRRTLQQVGPFDESFIVCGSDVEFCLRAQKKGLETLYNARVRLYHMESKTRDASDIPPVDFVRSEEVYREFCENGDPYYNKNLALNCTTPQIKR